MLRIKIEHTTNMVEIALKKIKKYRKEIIEDFEKTNKIRLILKKDDKLYELTIRELEKVSEGDNE